MFTDDDFYKITVLREEINKLKQRMTTIKGHLASIDFSNHTLPIVLRIGNTEIALSEVDNNTHRQRAIKGRDMLILGSRKTLQSIISTLENQIHEKQRAIRAVVAKSYGSEPLSIQVYGRGKREKE